jgi:hypothetical protein
LLIPTAPPASFDICEQSVRLEGAGQDHLAKPAGIGIGKGRGNRQNCSGSLRRPLPPACTSGGQVIGKLERIRHHILNSQAGRFLLGIRFDEDIVVPILSDDASDYSYWCVVNLMLLGLE